MSRTQKLRSLCFGLGALGGTVAIFATVLEQLYGDPEKNKFKSQLSTEKFAFFYFRFCLVDYLFLYFYSFNKKLVKANFSTHRGRNLPIKPDNIPKMEPKLGPQGTGGRQE